MDELLIVALLFHFEKSRQKWMHGCILQGTPPSGLCFAGMLIHFRSSKFQALDMSYFSEGHAGFFREF